MRINLQNDFEQFLKLKFLKKPKYLMTSKNKNKYKSKNWQGK